jgi:hypothetical protein
VFGEGRVGKGVELQRQTSVERRTFRRWASGWAFGGQIPGLAALLEIALDGRHGDLEGAHDLDAGHPVIDRGEHAQAQILRIASHARSMHHSSLLKQVALGR